ncbi:hypothetical protein ACB092_M006300, partial [Castanea dentata]
MWKAMLSVCDVYGTCGAFGSCNSIRRDKFECTCLPWLEPKSSSDWYLRDTLDWCATKQGISMCNNEEGFVKLAPMKVPNTSIARADMSLSLKECEQQCSRNCSCIAYASANESKGGIGCLIWHENLVDTRMYSKTRQDLYICVDAIVLATPTLHKYLYL